MSTIDEEIKPPHYMPDRISKGMLVKIGEYLMEGLSESEACILAGFSPAIFKEIKQAHEGVAMYLEKKNIEFKRRHLKQISNKSNDKNSMWMLENLRPEQFGPKRKGGDTTVNLIGAIIKDIRASSGTLPVSIQDAEFVTKGDKELTVASVLK